MFDNIGGKIKTMVWRSFQIKCVTSVLLGICLMIVPLFFGLPIGLLIGPLVAAVLIALAYLGSFKLYALGQLVENTDILAGRLQVVEPPPESPRSTKVIVTCGNCGFQFPERPKDTEPCPHCGSTFHSYSYPISDDTAAKS